MLGITDRAWTLLLESVCRHRLIEPVFQPIVDLSRGVVCGFEGLSRIQEPSMSAGPQEWFEAAAWHGYAAQLEATALQVVLDASVDLPPNCFLSVNLSPDAVLAPEIAAVLEGLRDMRGLVVEITEQSPVEDYDALVETLEGLRDRGAMIAVDDAGAGYASIRHLLALRPQIVKLDRSLIAGIDQDPHRSAAVSALGAFAGELDAWIIAEGVERGAELERLMDLHVPLVQGFYLGRPAQAMQQLRPEIASRLQQRQALRRVDRLTTLARPAPKVQSAPVVVAETTVVVDDHGRPSQVLVPAGGRRINQHPAMCAQPSDDLRSVALRATARHSWDRFAPICLCDNLGRLTGVVAVDTILETLARDLSAPERPDR